MGMVRKQWRVGQDEEDEYRRKLLLRARKGDFKAQTELMQKYGMRVYSDAERSKMPSYYDSGRKGSAPSLTPNRTRESTQAERKAETKKVTKTTAKAKKKI